MGVEGSSVRGGVEWSRGALGEGSLGRGDTDAKRQERDRKSESEGETRRECRRVALVDDSLREAILEDVREDGLENRDEGELGRYGRDGQRGAWRMEIIRKK